MGIILVTSYPVCKPNELQSKTTEFSDPSGDVKSGFPNFVRDQSFQDIINGTLNLTDNFISGSFTLNNIPEKLPLNKPLLKFPELPEDNLIYSFMIENQPLGIGIVHFSDQSRLTVKSDLLLIDIFKNNRFLATCGFAVKKENSLTFSCDKIVIPELKKIEVGTKWNAIVTYNDGTQIYQDCF